MDVPRGPARGPRSKRLFHAHRARRPVARRRLSRQFTYSVDNASFISGVMPEVWRRIEGRLYPLADERGLQVHREQKPVKTDQGHPVGGISNFTWKARKGLGPGFTLELKHNPRNYMVVNLKASAHYPLALAASIGLGALLSTFWLPYLLANWADLFRNPLFLVAVVAMWAVFGLLTRTIFLSGVLAALSSAAFGFIAGYGLGWLVAMAVARQRHGGTVHASLEALIDGLDDPTGPAAPPAYPSARAVQYGSAVPPLSNAAPAAPTPHLPTPKLVGSQAFPASSLSMAACPQCRSPVAVGVLNCPTCGLGLQWS